MNGHGEIGPAISGYGVAASAVDGKAQGKFPGAVHTGVVIDTDNKRLGGRGAGGEAQGGGGGGKAPIGGDIEIQSPGGCAGADIQGSCCRGGRGAADDHIVNVVLVSPASRGGRRCFCLLVVCPFKVDLGNAGAAASSGGRTSQGTGQAGPVGTWSRSLHPGFLAWCKEGIAFGVVHEIALRIGAVLGACRACTGVGAGPAGKMEDPGDRAIVIRDGVCIAELVSLRITIRVGRTYGRIRGALEGMIEVEGMANLMGKGLLSLDHLGGQHNDAVFTRGGSGKIGIAGDKGPGSAVITIYFIHYPYVVVLSRIPAAEILDIDIVRTQGGIAVDPFGNVTGNGGSVDAVDAVGGITVRIPLGQDKLDPQVSCTLDTTLIDVYVGSIVYGIQVVDGAGDLCVRRIVNAANDSPGMHDMDYDGDCIGRASQGGGGSADFVRGNGPGRQH